MTGVAWLHDEPVWLHGKAAWPHDEPVWPHGKAVWLHDEPAWLHGSGAKGLSHRAPPQPAGRLCPVVQPPPQFLGAA